MAINQVNQILDHLTEELSLKELQTLSLKLERKIGEMKEAELASEEDLRKICIVVQGHSFMKEKDKPGYYEYVLIDKETGKTRKKKSGILVGESVVRLIVLAIIDAINSISTDRRCYVQVISKCSWGFSKMKRKRKGVNSDLLDVLSKLIEEHNIKLDCEINSALVEEYLYAH